MTAALEVLRAGPQVSLQDGGRPGLMRFGVPASGAMDRLALRAANLALGNAPGEPAVEVSRGGFAVRAGRAVTLAVAGGGFRLRRGGWQGGSWQVLTLAAGEVLEIAPGPWGSWTYLAVAGGFEVARWAGSAATHAASGLGGGAVAAGSHLALAAPRVLGQEGPLPCPVWARPRTTISVVMGPQDRFFAPEVRARFLEGVFHLTDAGDRMGVRLRGPALMPENALGIPSEPLMRGAVQVSGDGGGTVLMADHQTTGGYPKIATLVGPETDVFAQARPHQPVRFVAVTAAAALEMTRARARAVARWEAAVFGR